MLKIQTHEYIKRYKYTKLEDFNQSEKIKVFGRLNIVLLNHSSTLDDLVIETNLWCKQESLSNTRLSQESFAYTIQEFLQLTTQFPLANPGSNRIYRHSFHFMKMSIYDIIEISIYYIIVIIQISKIIGIRQL